MQENIQIYQANRFDICHFLTETIINNGQFLHAQTDTLKNFYKILPSLELIYITDESYKQVSANIFRYRALDSALGRDRKYLVHKVRKVDSGVYLSDPYISAATGESCITLMMKVEEHFLFFDFNLLNLLTRFGLIERNGYFTSVTKSFYFAMGASLMFFAVLSIGYAFYDYLIHLFGESEFSIQGVFKPIIALTMGLAIFDLARTLMEREVFFKAYADKKDDARLLSKFLTAIIIALSIEALMVVFKIALNDTSGLLNALYLIIGVALIIVSLAIYNYSDAKSTHAKAKKIEAETAAEVKE